MSRVMSGAAATPRQLPVSTEDCASGVGEATSVIALAVVSTLPILAKFHTAGGDSMQVVSKAYRAGVVLVLG